MNLGIDIHWIDALSVATGIIYSLIKSKKKGITKLNSIHRIHYIATGVSLFPMFIMVISTFSSHLLLELSNSSRLILFVSGLYAIFAILDETPGKMK